MVTSSTPIARMVSRIGRGVVAGEYTRTGTPAAAPYAASAAPALPAVGTTRPFTPRALARVTAAASPRALNDAVGFTPSSFTHSRRTPACRASAGDSTRGVAPSPRQTGVSSAPNGSAAAYRQRSHRVRIRSRDGGDDVKRTRN